MIRLSNAISGAELNEIQKVFDTLISKSGFIRDEGSEADLAAHMIHMYLNGITEPLVLYEMGERRALARDKALKVGSKAAA